MPPARILIALAFALVSLEAACASRAQPVALQADAAAREALLGSWQGSYTIEGRRGGLISFTLLAGQEEAHGDVLMIPTGAAQPYGRLTPDVLPRTGGPVVESELLSIRFVRAENGRVSGTLTPYWDPARSCVAQATFSGTVDGRSMRGTFLSICDRGLPTYMGRWTMRRRR
jgi:hypothetical protein